MKELILVGICMMIPIILLVIIVNSPEPTTPEPVIYQPNLKTSLGDIGCTGAPTIEEMTDLDKSMGCVPTSDVKIGNATIIINVKGSNRTFNVNNSGAFEVNGSKGI